MSLSVLNELRAQIGLDPIQRWKSTTAARDIAIDKCRQELSSRGVSATNNVDDGELYPKVSSLSTPPTVDCAVSLARELGVNPKIARARLRRAGKSPTDGKWTFHTGDRDVIAAIIKK